MDLRFAVQLASFVLLVSGALWVRQDALKRRMSPHWGTGVFFVAIVFVPLYFLLRKPLAPAARDNSEFIKPSRPFSY